MYIETGKRPFSGCYDLTNDSSAARALGMAEKRPVWLRLCDAARWKKEGGRAE